MRKYQNFQIEKVKNELKPIYLDYDSLLDLSARLLLTINDAEAVLNELSISEIKPAIITVDANGIESKISKSHMTLELMANLGNEFAIQSIEKIYPELTKGRKFPAGKTKGSKGKSQEYIDKLVAANPTLKAKELMKLADEKIIGDINLGAFSNKVTAAKKLL